ncbi:MAG: hypothetical protein KIS67_05510 [Verrucomicrobiae bacterium]|nr:hypothetical protein [Verrucomicrobiae bacterium]
MALSLAVIFGCLKFTESDRKQRFTGFPARLFTLPVRTWQLVIYPMLFGAVAVSLIYLAWAGLVFRHRSVPFPFGWPCLYLATGMVCFQAIVWALANFRITRLIVLGVFGTVLTFGWILFSADILRLLMPGTERSRFVNLHTIQMGVLCALSVTSYGAACWAVGRQRQGASFKITWPRIRLVSMNLLVAWASRSCVSIRTGATPIALSPARPKPFASAEAAQSWFEWRRNGVLLPASVGVVLLLIVFPATLVRYLAGEPLSANLILWIVFWIFVLPFALAFIIGQGFGKTNFWGKELGLTLFHAVRPMTGEMWCAVKLKTAAWSALVTWLLVFVMSALWLAACVDWSRLPVNSLFVLQILQPDLLAGIVGLSVVVILFLFATLILLTWRLLAANIYLGVLDNKCLFNLSVCIVFITLFSAPGLGMWCLQHPVQFERLLLEPAWLPWTLTVCCLLKLGLAASLCSIAMQRGMVSARTALKYFTAWLFGTEALLLLVLLVPVSGAMSHLLALLAVLALPLVRVSLAPFAFARSRHH